MKFNFLRFFLSIYILIVVVFVSNALSIFNIHTVVNTLDKSKNTIENKVFFLKEKNIYNEGDNIAYYALINGEEKVIVNDIDNIGGNVYTSLNDNGDREIIKPDLIIGKHFLSFPFPDMISNFMDTFSGIIVFLILPAFFLICFEIFAILDIFYEDFSRKIKEYIIKKTKFVLSRIHILLLLIIVFILVRTFIYLEGKSKYFSLAYTFDDNNSSFLNSTINNKNNKNNESEKDSLYIKYTNPLILEDNKTDSILKEVLKDIDNKIDANSHSEYYENTLYNDLKNIDLQNLDKNKDINKDKDNLLSQNLYTSNNTEILYLSGKVDDNYTKPFVVTNIGDKSIKTGERTWVIKNENKDKSFISIKIENLLNKENGCNGQEIEVDEDCNLESKYSGDLGKFIRLDVIYLDKIIATTSLAKESVNDFNNFFKKYNDIVLDGFETSLIKIIWHIDENLSGNEIQGDEVSFDINFEFNSTK